MIATENEPCVNALTDNAELQRTAPHFSLTALLKALAERRRLVRNVFLTVLALTVLNVAVRRPVYTATASLMPPDGTSGAGSLMNLLASNPAASAASASGLLPGLRQNGELFVGVLQSRTVQRALVQQFGLQGYYHAKTMEDACRRLGAASAFQDNLKSGIVSIAVEDRDPHMAADLANGYAAELDRLLTHNSTSAAGRERAFLEGRLRQIKDELDVSSKALSAYASKNRTIDIPMQAKAMLEAGMRLDTELAGARSELVALRQTYSADNARVRAAEARIAELQRQMGQMNGASAAGSGGGATLENVSSASGYPSITALPTLALTYADLQRRAAVDEALWSALTKQYEAAKVQEAKEIPTVRLLDAAQVPAHKSNMSRLLLLMLGAMFGLLAGVVAAVLAQVWAGVDAERKRLVRSLVPLWRAA